MAESALSNEASTTTSLPAPTTLSVTNTTNPELTWTDNADNEDGYKVYRDQGNGFNQIADIVADSTYYQDTSASEGVSYTYKVAAYTEHTSSESSTVSITTDLPAPGSISLDTSTEDQITVSWTNNSSDEDEFLIQKKTPNGTFSQVGTVTANTTSYTDGGLDDGQEYHYRVASSTTDVTSWSSSVSDTTIMPAPSGVSLSVASSNAIDVSWTDNSDSEDSFYVRYSYFNDGGAFTITDTTAANATTHTISGLPDGEQVDVYVESFNSGVDNSSNTWSSHSSTLTATTDLPAPSSPSLTVDSSDQISLSWSDNSADEDGFKVFRSTDNQNFSQVADLAEGTTTYSDSGLTDGQTYYYYVQAYTEDATSSSSTNSTTTTLPAPSGVSIDSSVEDELTVSWTDNSPDESGFKVLRSSDLLNWAEIADVASNTTSYTDTNLPDGTQYHYKIRAYTSDTTADSSSTGATTILPAPTNFAVDFSVEDEATLTWTDNADTGGYKVYKAIDGGSYNHHTDLSGSTTSYTDTGLDDGEQYSYYVKVYTDDDSSLSGTVTGVAKLPDVSALSLDASTEDELTLTWTDESDSENGFKVHKSIDGGAYSQEADLAANTTSYTDTNLDDGEKYAYKVEVYTDDTSTTNGPVSAITQLPAPGGPTVDTSVEDEISLTWTDNSDAENGFEILRNTSNQSYSVIDSVGANATSYTDTPLPDGETYYYKIRATTDNTSSTSSSASGTTILPAPSGLSLDRSVQGEISLTWSDNSDSEDDFVVYRGTSSGGETSYDTLTPNTTSYTDSSVDDGEKYWYYVEAVTDEATSASSTVSGTTVLPAPSLSTSVAGPNSVDLSWTDSITGDHHYVIWYREVGASSWTDDGTVSGSTKSHTITGLSQNTDYEFEVHSSTAHSTSHSNQTSETTYKDVTRSSTANINSITASATSALIGVPNNLSASATAENEVTLTWDAVADAGGFYIYRALSSGSTENDYTRIDDIGGGNTSYVDADDGSSVADGEQYYYRVSSYE